MPRASSFWNSDVESPALSPSITGCQVSVFFISDVRPTKPMMPTRIRIASVRRPFGCLSHSSFVCLRTVNTWFGDLGASGMAAYSDLSVHQLVIGLERLVLQRHRVADGDARLLARDHDLVDTDARIVVREPLGLRGRILVALARIGECLREALAEVGLGLRDLVELRQRLDRLGAVCAVDDARLPIPRAFSAMLTAVDIVVMPATYAREAVIMSTISSTGVTFGYAT